MSFRLLLLPALGLVASCSSDQQNPVSATANTPENKVVRTALPVVAAGPRATSSGKEQAAQLSADRSLAKSTFQLLQGKWQSTEDEKDVIELKGHRYIDYYDGLPLDTTSFILVQACSSRLSAGRTGDNERYLVQPSEDMCWEVVGVDEESLELSYTARGNSLNYRKLK